jgi:hypothetical protein
VLTEGMKVNSKSAKVRGLRLTVSEEALVESFLAANPIFDFTTLVRASLREFIVNPKIEITPVPQLKSNVLASKAESLNNSKILKKSKSKTARFKDA